MPTRLLAIDRRLDTEQAEPCALGELNLIGVARRLSRDQELFGQGDKAACVYKVVSGAMRATRLLADGRRQVTEFHLPGDVFGIELGAEHTAGAEAICETVVVSARRSNLSQDHDQAILLWRHAMGELQRSQAHLLTLGRRSAMERIAVFLVDLVERTGAGEQLSLPMSRQDIADYLGLTIETVSRTLTRMQAQGLVALGGCRKVRLLKRADLADLCG
jgi:CRP/FNR family nitrogen fixation transcriptional regulator